MNIEIRKSTLTPGPSLQERGGCPGEEKKIVNNRSNWMVGGKRVQFSVQINIRGVNHDSCGVRIQDFDIRIDLGDRRSQCRMSIYHGMFAE